MLPQRKFGGVQTVQGWSGLEMRGAVYNLAIPNTFLSLVKRVFRSTPVVRGAAHLSCALLVLAVAARAADWSGPEQQLTRKIVAVTGAGMIALTVENRSSLGQRESEVIQNGLRSALEGAGIRLVKAENAGARVAISLSENPTSYVWVAEIRRGEGEAAVVMVSAPRTEGSIAPRESVPLSLRKIPLWTQDDPILDVAVLEQNATPTRIAVLGAEKLTLYQLQGQPQAGKWQQEQALGIVHARPWPRDLRGRLIAARDHFLDAYLPGMICRSTGGTPLALNCRESDDPWPLVPSGLSGMVSNFPSAGSSNVAAIPPVGAFYASARDFFTGVLTPGVGKFTTVSKFYSAALLPREKYVLWLFAATDGHVHMVDGVSDEISGLGWGSDVASVKTSCGAGWQVLAASSEPGSGDSVRAYEFPDRDPMAVSAAVDFAGTITALWTEAKGDTAVVVARNRATGTYEAYRLAITCSQ
jgi:hypothetical protein